ncbi:hypothetical protein FIBSPDRAFT_864961, partial [Athelia psychrophila]
MIAVGCGGGIAPILCRSPSNLVQSDSLTSCVANGCGAIGEGGGMSGNPLIKLPPRAIR